ncbi:MAG: hypothetical protein JWM44_4333 [Bacilli bacterium]|nr:hypothetical protein [Bacilli bacterium]
MLGVILLALTGCFGNNTVKTIPMQAVNPQIKPSPTILPSLQITQIFMMNSAMGWGSDSSGNILQTTNGGLEWINRNPENIKSGNYFPFILNDKIAWVFNSTSLTMYRTTDGGLNWNKGEAIIPNITFDSGLDIFFTDAEHGWLELMSGGHSQTGELFKTNDGGMHWYSVTGFNKDNTKMNKLPFGASITFRDLDHGWTGTWSDEWGPHTSQSNVWLFKTNDGGKNWVHQDLPIPLIGSYQGTSLMPPKFFDNKNGILPVTLHESGNNYKNMILKTTDGGASWQSIKAVPFENESDLLTVFHTKDFGWAWNRSSSKIFITKNGGEHWNEIFSNLNLSAVQQLIFVDENRGFLLTNTNNGEIHELYKTEDAGKTWSLISPSLLK